MMITSDKWEECGETSDEFCRPAMPLSKETLRDLIGLVAECVLERWAKENEPAEALHVSSESSVSFSAQIFILLLNEFVSLKREMELEVIAHQYAFNRQYRELLNKIAAIISHTYIELGDGAEFADDEALILIRDLLLGFDSTIINCNRFKRITRHYKSGYKFGNGG